MTTVTTYFGNRARAAVVPAAGTPALADLFTVDRGFEANITWEAVELYGTDSVLRADEAKYSVKVEIKMKGCKFYADSTGANGIMKMLLNSLNGATGGTGAIADTNTLYLMDAYIYQVGTASGANFSVTGYNCYLDGFPMAFPENDFITLDLTFRGRTGAYGTATAPTV